MYPTGPHPIPGSPGEAAASGGRGLWLRKPLGVTLSAGSTLQAWSRFRAFPRKKNVLLWSLFSSFPLSAPPPPPHH